MDKKKSLYIENGGERLMCAHSYHRVLGVGTLTPDLDGATWAGE